MNHLACRIKARKCVIIWDGYGERKVSPRLSFQNKKKGNGLLLSQSSSPIFSYTRTESPAVLSLLYLDFQFPSPSFSLPLHYLLGKSKDDVSHSIQQEHLHDATAQRLDLTTRNSGLRIRTMQIKVLIFGKTNQKKTPPNKKTQLWDFQQLQCLHQTSCFHSLRSFFN